MPPKPSVRMRSWGTRFDTLPTSPPVSPPAREAAPDDAAPPGQTPEQTPAIDSSIPKRREEKMPHDASVFVGSLPSTIDQHELTRLLSEHLSEHTEVKNIKVVRDSKGGVCAFVQCEDAASAATLIHTLHSSPPRQFLGRTLRYEPARAFRTLLISYRTPMQSIPGNGVENNSAKPQAVELDLPSAMRVWRPWNSKFYSLLYNNDAIDAENYTRNNLSASTERASLFLQPVVFNAESIGELAAYFGRLESIKPFQVSRTTGDVDPVADNAEDDWKLYPAPHDAPRSSKMDTGCWEIKWEHRDDCVSALMALRRVPHLTVTWAHQPPPFGLEQRSPYTPFAHHNAANYPLHVQDPDRAFRPRNPAHGDPFGFSRGNGNGTHIRPMRTPGNASSVASDTEDEPSDTDTEEGAVRRIANSVAGDGHPVKWSDMDFPPLGNAKGSMKTGSGVWSDRKASSSQHTRSPSLDAYSATSDFRGVGHGSKDYGQELDMPPTPGLGRSPLTPRTPGFPPTPTTGDGDMHAHRVKGHDGGKDHGYYDNFASRERDIDPMTLFVGGLETFGPGAWDEEKVTKFFSRFGGLEDVKIVRPLNSHAAFAFVKFNNTESPARAVFEEHNRVYEGRTMRVQLRDCNPPRGSWRNNRGRGRFFGQQNFGPHRRGQDHQDKMPERPDSRESRRQEGQNQGAMTASQDEVHEQAEAQGDAEPPVYSETIALKPSEEPTEDIQEVNPSPENTTSPPSTPFTSLNAPASVNYREWYDNVPVPSSVTPPPSSFGSSASAPASAPPMPYMAGGYYPPAPWVHPYGQPMQYPMPFMGYSGYPMPGPQFPQPFPRPPGPDGNIAANPASWNTVGMYGSYIPYQTQTVRTPTVETTPSQNMNNRAPLAPTGFIQNEQGTLIAVYQPEALDQYMTGAHIAPPALPQPSVQNMQSWPQYPQSPAYPFPAPPPAIAMPSRPNLPSAAPNMTPWVQNGLKPQQQLATPHVTQAPHLPGAPGAFRGGYSEPTGQGTPPQAPFRRQAGPRRDQSNLQNNSGRTNQRSFPNRHGRGGHMNNGGYQGHGDHHNSTRTPFISNGSEWNQWGAAGR